MIHDTRCYSNVRAKANTTRLNSVPHGNNNKKVENRKKTKKYRTDMFTCIGKQSKNSGGKFL